MSLGLFHCSDEPECASCNCSTPATVVDLTGLDGCGIVLELEDGSRLEPWVDSAGDCVTMTGLDASKWEDGAKVYIDYDVFSAVSICMVGERARITCIRERPSSDEE